MGVGAAGGSAGQICEGRSSELMETRLGPEAQRVVLEVIAILHPVTPKQTEVTELLHPLSLPLNFPPSVKIYQQHKRHCQTAVIDSNYTVPKPKLTIQKLL